MVYKYHRFAIFRRIFVWFTILVLQMSWNSLKHIYPTKHHVYIEEMTPLVESYSSILQICCMRMLMQKCVCNVRYYVVMLCCHLKNYRRNPIEFWMSLSESCRVSSIKSKINKTIYRSLTIYCVRTESLSFNAYTLHSILWSN